MTKQSQTQVLVEKAKAGDRSAFDQLAQQYGGHLKQFVQSRLGSGLRQRVDADDVVQETLVRSFEMIDRFSWRGEESFLRWLCAIASHLILNASQKKGRGTLRLLTDVPGGVSPSRVARREERLGRLEEAVKGLTPDQRKAVILARLEGLPIKEIAKRMNRSAAAVKQLLTRALKQMKQSMGDTESLHLPDRELLAGDHESLREAE